MTLSFGEELQSRRKSLGMTQGQVAARLKVNRANVSQWETGTESPAIDRVRQLDDLYGASGALLEIAARRPGAAPAVERLMTPRLSDVLQDVADALVEALIRDSDGRPVGWSHDLAGGSPATPLSTAYVIRTLQRLDDSRVDLYSLADGLLRRRDEDGGWTNRFAVGSRPEVTAVVLSCLARLGRLPDVEAAIGHLVDSLDRFATSRPYILTSVLDALLVGHPEPKTVGRVVRALLNARTTGAGPRLWVLDADAPAQRVEPSLAPTARAATLLRLARRIVAPDQLGEIDDAVGAAVDWIVARTEPDVGITEILKIRSGAGDRATVPIYHFTAAWCVRLLSTVDGVPRTRLDAAMEMLWASYSTADHLWSWPADGSLPSWMTHDAVAALRAYALATTNSGFAPTLPRPRSPEAHLENSSGTD